jgi:hypothetical protein
MYHKLLETLCGKKVEYTYTESFPFLQVDSRILHHRERVRTNPGVDSFRQKVWQPRKGAEGGSIGAGCWLCCLRLQEEVTVSSGHSYLGIGNVQ